MRRSVITVLLLLGVFLPATIIHASPPFIGPCQILPANNPWNADISGAAVDHTWDSYIANIGSTPFHPDFGADFGIPWTTVTSTQAKVPMIFTESGDESDPGPYPFPVNTPIEGGGDAHAIVIETTNCVLYETWLSDYVGGSQHTWSAGSGAIFNLDSNAIRKDGWTSADAAGLPIFPGLARCVEDMSGQITHALRLTLDQTGNSHIYPATHDAGSGDNFPPMGQRFRLKASVNPMPPFTGQALVIFNALKTYGLILADNGSDWYVSGEPNPCWVNEDLDQLKRLHGSDFEAIVSPAAPGVTLNPPTLYSPVNNAQLSSTPILDWNTVTSANRYEVALDQNPSPTTHVAYVNATEITEYKPTIPLITGFTYYWAVRVVDTNNIPLTNWSTAFSFTDASAVNAAPVRNFDTTGTPTLTWNRLLTAVRYEVEVASNSAFSGGTIYDAGSNLYFTLPTALTTGTYYWHVHGCTDASPTSCGSWSATESILVNH